MASDAAHVRELYRRIYAVVRTIPRGAVATYGQVAELAGIPGGARVAGAAMKTSGDPKWGHRLPWQRVIGKAGKLRGRIAIYDPVGAAIQRGLLEREGVAVGPSGHISLELHGWLPAGRGPRLEAGGPRAPRATAGSGRAASPRRRPRSGSKRRASSSRR